MSTSQSSTPNMSFANAFRQTADSTLVPGLKGPVGTAMMAPTNSQAIFSYDAFLQATLELDVIQRFDEAYLYAKQSQDPEYLSNLLIALLQKRRVRGGEGLRKHFYVQVVHLYENHLELREFILKLVPFIPHLGCFRDYWQIMRQINTREPTTLVEQIRHYQLFNPLVAKITKSFLSQIRKDMSAIKNQTPELTPQLSLAGKWFPRQKGEEDQHIHWFLPMYQRTQLNGLHKRSLFHYLTIARWQSHFIEALKPSQVSQLAPSPLQKKTRKTYALLNKYLQTTEVYMAAKNWTEIDFQKVTAKAHQKFRQAFKNLQNKKGHMDEERYPYDDDRHTCAMNHREHMTSGKFDKGNLDPTTLMKQIRDSYSSQDNEEQEQMWLALVNQTFRDVITYYVQLEEKVTNTNTSTTDEALEVEVVTDEEIQTFLTLLDSDTTALKQNPILTHTTRLQQLFAHLKKLHNEKQSEILQKMTSLFLGGIIPVMDVSGSMCCSATPQASCMDICVALGTLFTYVNPGPFRDLAISFTDRPFTFNFESLTVKQRVNKVFQHVGYNTNVELMMKEYLRIATTNQIPEDQLADIVIFSDGGFDMMLQTNGPNWQTAVQGFETMFRQEGYNKMPQIYFWNLSANQRNFQASPLRKGVSQLNGYSPASFQQILTGDKVLETLQKDPSQKSQKCTEDDFLGKVRDKYFDLFRLLMSDCETGLLQKYSFNPDNSEALQQYHETRELVEQYHNQKSSKRSDEARPKSAPPQLEMEVSATATATAEPNPVAVPEETTSGFWRMMGY